MAFFKDCWEVVNENILKLVVDFYNSRFLDLGRNATFIFLIPEKEGVTSIIEF